MKRLLFALCVLLFCPLIAKEYKLGRDPTWYPYNFKVKNSSVNGYINTLIAEIGQREKITLDIIEIDTLILLQGLDEKDYAGVLSIAPLTDQNVELYSFSKPLLELGPVLVVPKSSKRTSLAQLGGRIVGISPFNNSVLIVQKYPSIIIRPFMSLPLALQALSEGEIDGVMLPALGAHALVYSQFGKTLKIVSQPLNQDGIRLLTLKGKNAELLKAVNQSLQSFKRSGHLKNLQKKFDIY